MQNEILESVVLQVLLCCFVFACVKEARVWTDCDGIVASAAVGLRRRGVGKAVNWEQGKTDALILSCMYKFSEMCKSVR